MPLNTFASQFTRSDFFAVIPTGLYNFCVFYSCFSLSNGYLADNNTLWGVILQLSSDMYDYPLLSLFVLFASYLIGNVLRALPVYWAVKTLPPYSAKFPNPEILKEVVDTIEENHQATMIKKSNKKLPDLSKGVPMHVYNYWKDILCLKTPEGFQYYQNFETRVRFFTGMVWAAWTGVAGSIYIMIARSDFFHGVGFPLLIISFVLLIAFGANIRRVRRQESRALVTLFLAYLQTE